MWDDTSWFDGWDMDAEGNRVRVNPRVTEIGGKTYTPMSGDPSRFGPESGTPDELMRVPEYAPFVKAALQSGDLIQKDGQWYSSTDLGGKLSSVMHRNNDPVNKFLDNGGGFWGLAGAGLGFALGPGFAGFADMGTAIPGLAEGTSAFGALTGNGAVATPGVGASDIPSSYFRMLADSGGVASDAAPAAAGSIGSDFSSTQSLFNNFYNAAADGALTPATGSGITTATLAGAEDAVRAIDLMDQASGGAGATAGAQALGYNGVYEALRAANPAWLTNTGSAAAILQKLGLTGAAQALTSGSGGFSASDIPWTSLLGPAATLGAGALGASAASKAAQAGVDASNAAIGEQRRQFDVTQANNAPFLATGTAANARLKALLGLDPNYTGTDSGSLTRKFTAADMEADPVYQSGLKFGLDEGTKGINARAIAGGGYDSGATLKALTRFGNDYASTKGNESYNRFNTDATQVYNRLAGVSGAGQTAVNTVANAGTNATNAISGNITDAGNARAAGIVGGANAWGGAAQGINSALNSYQSNQILQALLRNNNGSYYG